MTRNKKITAKEKRKLKYLKLKTEIQIWFRITFMNTFYPEYGWILKMMQ